MSSQYISELMEKYNTRFGGLISILEEIQNKYGYLPEGLLREVAEKTGKSLVDIFGIATFYKAFRLKPRGDHLITVCSGTACHVHGSPAIVEEFKKKLGLQVGETTPDKKFTLETVNCLGSCALGPIVVIDGYYFSRVTKSMVAELIKRAAEGLDKVDIYNDKRIFPLEVKCPDCNHSLMDSEYKIDGLPSIRVTLSHGQIHGAIRLSCLYGSHTIHQEFEIPAGVVVHIFCPHCHTELTSASLCPECEAPMFSMIVRGGGVVQVCSRRNCKGHMLEMEMATI